MARDPKAAREAMRRHLTRSLERYRKLISSGGSDYPYNLFKKAGIDFATPAGQVDNVTDADPQRSCQTIRSASNRTCWASGPTWSCTS